MNRRLNCLVRKKTKERVREELREYRIRPGRRDEGKEGKRGGGGGEGE